MTERVGKTLEFLQERFESTDYFRKEPGAKNYRFEHSVRVARICAQIARAEGMKEELATIAGLLHDVGYGADFPEDYDWKNHGRDGAHIARPFLESLGLSGEEVQDICYAIAIHVDDKADFAWSRTAFSETVGDADNIDRFDVYRIYETVKYKGFEDQPLNGRTEWLRLRLEQLEKLYRMSFGTPTATALWKEKVSYQIDFYTRLLNQMELGRMENLV